MEVNHGTQVARIGKNNMIQIIILIALLVGALILVTKLFKDLWKM
jgi:hypothetical protein